MPKNRKTKKFTKALRDIQFRSENVLRQRQIDNQTNRDLPPLVESSGSESEDFATPLTDSEIEAESEFEEEPVTASATFRNSHHGGHKTDELQGARNLCNQDQATALMETDAEPPEVHQKGPTISSASLGNSHHGGTKPDEILEDRNKSDKFQGITGVDGERARFYLESAGWQVDLAMSSFYEADGEEASEPMEDAPEPAQAGKINFMPPADDDDSSDEDGQAFYAGGSTSSGQQILGPPKKKDKKRDIVGDMFKAARDAGAEEVAGGSGLPGGSRLKAFTGSGFKLGADATAPSEAVEGAKVAKEPRHFVLKMWKDGFSIDDEDIRKYDDPANREFLESVMRGNIPPELVKEAKGGEVHVDMKDHRQEDFVKPKTRPKAFGGKGNVLGSIAPSIEPPPAAATADPAAAEKAAAAAAKINTDEPTNNVQPGVLLGMGNPLLDISAEVKHELLRKHNLKPNDAILTEDETIFEDMKRYKLDYIAGGATQNSIRVAQWILDKKDTTAYFGCVGRDATGKILAEKAREAGVNVQYQINTKYPTGRCAVLITGHERSLVTKLDAAEHYNVSHLEEADNWKTVEAAKVVYSAGFFLTVSVESMLKVAQHCADNDKTYCLNLAAPFLIQSFKEQMKTILPFADIVFGNETEAAKYAKVHFPKVKDVDVASIAKQISMQPKENGGKGRIVILTQGSGPVIVVEHGRVLEFPVTYLPKNKIVDTNGAGDAFVGGFLAQYVQDKPLETAVRCGIWAATHVIQRSGCTYDETCNFHDDTMNLHSEDKLMELVNAESHNYEFDVIVLGGGSGGLACSKELSRLGKKVAVCDFIKPTPKGTTWGLGGTCVNVGCIPKKLMHQAALLGEGLKDAESFGWQATPPVHSWEKLKDEVQNHIGSLNWGDRVQLREKGVTYMNEYAEFIDEHTVKTVNKKGKESTHTANKFVIATGGRPTYPGIPGDKELGITSDDLFSLPYAPGKTLLVGGGYIALECAGFLKGLGFDVTVMVRSIFLRGFDQQMAIKIGDYMEEHGINMIKECVPESLEEVSPGTPGTIKVNAKYKDGTPFTDEFNTVVFAIGRTACTENIGLDKVGVELNPKNGKIIHNEGEQTAAKHVYAIGDVLDGKLELTPVAIQAGKLLARRLTGQSDKLMDYVNVCTTVFTPLEYGACGMSEEDARAKYGEDDVEVYHTGFQPLEWTVAHRPETACYAKLVCVKSENEKVVGFHYLGPNAGEVTQGFGGMIMLGATKEHFDNLVGIHPTTAETFTTLDISKSSGEDAAASGC